MSNIDRGKDVSILSYTRQGFNCKFDNDTKMFLLEKKEGRITRKIDIYEEGGKFYQQIHGIDSRGASVGSKEPELIRPTTPTIPKQFDIEPEI